MKKHQHNQRARRAGTFMLEAVIVVSVSALLIGLITGSVHHLLSAHGNLRDNARNGLVQQRLTMLFRRDCREALSAEADGTGLTLTMRGSRQVNYKVDGNVVFRSWSDDNGKGRDRFYSTRNWECKITLSDRTAQLVLSQAFGGSKRTQPGNRRQLVAKARVGAHAAMIAPLKRDQGEDAGEPRQK